MSNKKHCVDSGLSDPCISKFQQTKYMTWTCDTPANALGMVSEDHTKTLCPLDLGLSGPCRSKFRVQVYDGINLK